LCLFGHKREINVTMTYDVILKCKCVTCPVQADSPCAKPKIGARNDMVKNPGNMIQQIMSPRMMKNLEMLKNMNPGQLRGMSRDQMQSMSDEMMKNTPKEQIAETAPKAEDMPGPYCANGVAVCKYLDLSKTCSCSSCVVFKDYNLSRAKPTSYYLEKGNLSRARALHSIRSNFSPVCLQ
jgi:hypothetical protein